MLIGIFGKPRSGKSYETVAHQIIPTLRSGRKVITNIPLNIDVFNLMFGADFIEEHLEIRTESIGLVTRTIKDPISGRKKKVQVKGHPFESIECYEDAWRNERGVGALLIIDECHYSLPSRSTPIEISQWYSKHGHVGFDIILVTQNFRKVDRDIKDMMEVVHYVHKMTTFGEPDKYIRKIKNGLDGDYDVDNQEIREYDSTYFPYYKSHSLSEMVITEEGAKDINGRKGTTKRKSFRIMMLIMVSMIIFLFYRLGFKEEIEPEKKVIPVKKVERVKKQNSEDENSTKVLNAQLTTEQPAVYPVHEIRKDIHPYYKVNLHISGSIKEDESISYVFNATLNGYHEFTLITSDLIKAGYVLTPISDCLMEISFKDLYSDFLVCDSPEITGSFASN